MNKLISIFPLSIFKDSIALPEDYKQQLIRAIFEMEAETAEAAHAGDEAWLGDTRGFAFLFQKPLFEELYRRIAETIRAYIEALGLNNELLDFYFQRSWAKITRKGEKIHEHCHAQSNLSCSYYLRKPPHSGGIQFTTQNHPNEFATGMFSSAKADLGLIQQQGVHTCNAVVVEPAEGDIFVFPSKSLHGTVPSESGDARISISADITTMLRDSYGHETMMPHFSNWRRFDE